MSGSEWTNDDEPERRDDAGPLSPEVEAGPEPVHIPGVSRAPAQPPEPAMARAHAPSDRDEPAPAGPSEGNEAGPRKTSGVLSTLLALLSKIPLPSLGSERHEMMPDAPAAPAQAEDRGPEPTAPRAHSRTKRAPGRFPFPAMKRETRVGIAALVSFIFLVTALVNKRGWIGGKPITVAITNPTDGGPASPSPEATPRASEPPPSTEAAPKSEEAKAKPTAKAKKEPGEPGPGLAPRVGDEVKPPEPVPDESSPSKLTMAGGPTAGELVALPPTGPETMKSATLASTTPPTSPPALPADLLPNGAGLPADSTASAQPPPPVETPALPPPPTLPVPTEPPPTNSVEPPMLPVEARPPATEFNPPPATDPPPVAEPSTMPAPPAEKPQAPSAVAEATPPPIPTPAPSPTPTPASPPVAATAPVLAEQPPKLEEVPVASASHEAAPAGPIESAATKTSTIGAVGPVGAVGAGWVVIQSGGRRIVGASPIVSTPSDDQADPPRVADGPRVSDDLAAADQVEPVVHVVRAGENFWTISKLYYRSGRFYRALHAANRRQVPRIDELYVGTVLRIPPPEALDRSLIDPPGRSNTDGATTSTVSRTSKRVDAGVDADLAVPSARPRMIRPDPEAVEAPRRPTYTVKPHETLRSIARDTLNDPRRDREIYNLNRDVLNDINVLEPGTTLTLPEDAIVGRRSR